MRARRQLPGARWSWTRPIRIPSNRPLAMPASRKNLLVNLAFFVALVILAAAGRFAYQRMNAMIAADQREDLTFQVNEELERLLLSLTEAEAAGRGFIITGEEHYAAHFEAAASESRQRLATLQALTKNNAAEQQHLAQLQALMQKKLAWVSQTIQVRSADGFPAASAAVRTEQGTALMDQIRQEAALIQAVETFVLQDSEAEKRASTRRAHVALGLATLVSVVLLATVFGLLKRQISQCLKVENELFAHQHHLQDLVAARTQELEKANQQLQADIAERQRIEEALRRSEARIRGFFEKAGVGIVEVAANDRFVAVNDRVCEILGYQREELLGLTVHDLTAPEDRAQSDALNRQLHDGERDRIDYEKRYVKRDGSPLWVHVTVSPLRDAQGRWVGGVATVEDIAERKAATEALLQSQAAQQHANQELQTLAEQLRHANESLETRVVQRTSELKQRTAQLQALAGELTRAEERERRRIAQVIHDHLQQLLVAARMNLDCIAHQDEAAPVRKELKEMMDLVGEALNASRSLTSELCPTILNQGGLGPALQWLSRWYAEKHGLTVSVETEDEIDIPAQEIRVLLFHSVRELLFNIVKHAQVKRATVRLGRAEDGAVRIVVCDDGVGFDPAAVRAREGTTGGFGLFSVRERLDLLGGRLEVESAPSHGSRFTILAPLPAQARPSAGAPVPALHVALRAEPRPPAPAHPKIRIVLIDDHAVVRDGLARALRDEQDFEVVGQGSDGREALELARHLHPDVVLMDVSMADVNGIDATRLVTTEFPQIKIIGLSMFDDDAHRAAMHQAGAVEYLDKNAPSAQVVAAIRKQAGVLLPPVPKAA